MLALQHLREHCGVVRVWVPAYVCRQVVRAAHAARVEVVFADNCTETLSLRLDPGMLRSGDAVILPNLFGMRARPLPPTDGRIFVIEDNASTFLPPGAGVDLTVYSFGAGKDLSSCEGGLLVSARAEFDAFVRSCRLPAPGSGQERRRFRDYRRWRLKSQPAVYWVGKQLATWRAGRRGAAGRNAGGTEPQMEVRLVLPGGDVGMCAVSKRMAMQLWPRLPKLRERAMATAAVLVRGLASVPGITVLPPAPDSLHFCVNLLLRHREAMLPALASRGIFLSVPWSYVTAELLGQPCPPGAAQLRRELGQIMIDPVRMTPDDAEYIVAATAEAARRISATN